MTQPIKWDHPEMIEITMGAFVVQDYGDRIDYSGGLYTVYVDDIPRKFWPDGRSAGSHPYAIRNKQAPAQPAPPPELPDDVMEVVRWVAEFDTDLWLGTGNRAVIEKARAFLAEPEPKPDPLLVEAIALVKERYPEAEDTYRGRRFDIALAALKRGIELGERK